MSRQKLVAASVWAAILALGGCASPHGSRPKPARATECNGPAFTARFYPPAARGADIAGVAVLKLLISDDGEITHAEIKSETPPGYGFGEAALHVVAGYCFSPAIVDGKPVASTTAFTIHFTPR